MSIPPPLIAAVEPVPRSEAGGTAPEDTGTFSLTLCTCQSPQPESGATVPKQPMAQEAPTGSPGPHSPHTLPPPWGWPLSVVSGSLRISKTSPPSHPLSSASCKSSHVTLRLWCHYCSHYPVWLCMRCHRTRLQDSPHSRGTPHPGHRSSGQWGSMDYPNTSHFGGKTLNLYIRRSVCKRRSADPGLACQGSKGESSETSRQLCVVCSPLGPATAAVGSRCLLQLRAVGCLGRQGRGEMSRGARAGPGWALGAARHRAGPRGRPQSCPMLLGVQCTPGFGEWVLLVLWGRLSIVCVRTDLSLHQQGLGWAGTLPKIPKIHGTVPVCAGSMASAQWGCSLGSPFLWVDGSEAEGLRGLRVAQDDGLAWPGR